MVTGSASSIVGTLPQDGVYDNPLIWADHEEINKPNEKAKLLGERTMWNTVTRLQNEEQSQLKFCSILPYFMVGPPLLQNHATTNSSCQAILSNIRNELQVYPNVSLPSVDVRDVANAHV